ncbi:cineole-1 [Forsythia ovata]|uniref:Cineole-1 n=1 Tax=Forsythia ovata TaxID=205694 RepID=A0ABD1S4E1_9LAMI
MAYDVLKDHGLNIIPNTRKLVESFILCSSHIIYILIFFQSCILLTAVSYVPQWAELCRAYLTEARWYYSGYFPSLSEYLNTAWISIAGPLILFHAYVCTINPILETDLGNLEQYPGTIRWPALVLRLMDDLGTSSDEIKRGDVPKSIQCYMHETGCSEEDARDHIKYIIDVTLKKMNKDILMDSPFKDFVGTAMNLARISQCIYQYGDGFGVPHLDTQKNLFSLLVEPILL